MTDLASVSLNIAAGDSVKFELYGDIFNNTGGNRTYEVAIVIGSKTVVVQGSAVIATANIVAVQMVGFAVVRSTSVLRLFVQARLNPATPDGTSVTDITRLTWSFSTSDFTGPQTCKIQIRATAAGVTNTITCGTSITHLKP